MSRWFPVVVAIHGLTLAIGQSDCRGDTGQCTKVEAPAIPNSSPEKDHMLLQTQHVKLAKTSKSPLQTECHTAVPGEPCHEAVTWAKDEGIHSNPEWYEGLTASSSFEEFQSALHEGGHGNCPEPCSSTSCQPAAVQRRRRQRSMCSCRRRSGRDDLAAGWSCIGNSIQRSDVVDRSPKESPDAGQSPALPGWHPTGETVGNDWLWCKVGVPRTNWNLRACNVAGPRTRVKVLAYNLFWWNLFGRRGGNGGSAGRKIAHTGSPEPYDIMGLQECDDPWRVLHDAGLAAEYGVVSRGMAVAIAYRKSRWTVISDGMWDVAEDRREQHYGRRGAQFARLRNTNGRVVFFVNHHGPLPVGTGGQCGGRATAYNILRTIASNAHSGDHIIMVGDFNANRHHSTIKTLDEKIHRVFTGTAIGGIDHIYSNCAGSQHVISTSNLGTGGSDHDALSAVLEA